MDVFHRAEQIHKAIQFPPLRVRDRGLVVTVSIGTAFADNIDDTRTLLDRAFAALQRAKDHRRGRLET